MNHSAAMPEYPREDRAALRKLRRLIATYQRDGDAEAIFDAARLMVSNEWQLQWDGNRSELAFKIASFIQQIAAESSRLDILEAGLAVVDTELSRIPQIQMIGFFMDMRSGILLTSARALLLGERYYLTGRLDDLYAAYTDMKSATDLLRQIPDIIYSHTRVWCWLNFADILGRVADITDRIDQRAGVVEALQIAHQVRRKKPGQSIEIRAQLALAWVQYWQRYVLTDSSANAELAKVIDWAIRELTKVIEKPDLQTIHLGTWLQNLAVMINRRARPEDEAIILEYVERGLRVTPKWDAGTASLLDVKAHVLRRRAARTAQESDQIAAEVALHRAYDSAAKYGGLRLNRLASEWAWHCADAGRWAETASAGEAAVAAAEEVVRVQTHVDYRRTVLAETPSIAGLTAQAWRRLGRLSDAAAVLDRGQVIVLSEDYVRPNLVVYTLERSGHKQLATEYREAVNAARRLRVDDAELRRARSKLAELSARLSEIPDIAPSLGSASDPVALLAGTHAAYIAPGFALVIDATGSITDVDLPNLSEEDAWYRHQNYARRVVDARNPQELRISTIESTCAWLEKSVMDTLMAALDGVESVILIPTHTLAGLPFHAAGNAIHKQVFSYLPAAIMTRPAVSRFDNQTKVAIIADPERPGARELPGTRREADHIRNVFPRSSALVGAEASRENVDAALEHAELIHFGCHGVGDSRDVLGSSLLLAGEDKLQLMDLLDGSTPIERARLVVLSACQTSPIDRKLPGESLNLTTGFLAAGANAVIGSLWPVPDEPTAELMVRFYERLSHQVSPARALRDAQLSVQTETAWNDRYYWAGFVYVGS